MEEKVQTKGQINIELDEQTAQGTYVNLAVITHSSSEFIIDYIRMMPGVPKAKVKSRVIQTPENAKRLFLALKENIAKYEAVYGKIKNVESSESNIPMTFGGPQAQA
ncbi:MAG: DUF3467 domain-containing protein [Paludibacteraceae bacterium]|nr:DUF3467 domain-containing protein [Paludibacteraceae bacterium]